MAFNPYIYFSGDCAEAFERYSEVFGLPANLIRVADTPADPAEMPALEPHHVMHAAIELGGSYLMGSDDPSGDGGPKVGYSVSYTAPDVASVSRVVDALAADGGTVTMPVEATFWAPAFGMVTDRFGVSWMVDSYPAEPD